MMMQEEEEERKEIQDRQSSIRADWRSWLGSWEAAQSVEEFYLGLICLLSSLAMQFHLTYIFYLT